MKNAVLCLFAITGVAILLKMGSARLEDEQGVSTAADPCDVNGMGPSFYSRNGCPQKWTVYWEEPPRTAEDIEAHRERDCAKRFPYPYSVADDPTFACGPQETICECVNRLAAEIVAKKDACLAQLARESDRRECNHSTPERTCECADRLNAEAERSPP